jgi:hypothetical protein
VKVNVSDENVFGELTNDISTEKGGANPGEAS